MDLPFFNLAGVAFVIMMIIYTATKTLFHLKRNSDLRRSVRKLGKILARQEPLDKEGWRRSFVFPVATIASGMDMTAIRSCLQDLSTPFLEIEQCSAVTDELFFMAGWFRGSVLLGFKRNSFERESMVKLYPAYLLLCQDEPGKVSLFSSEPEDEHQDYYLQDLAMRLREQIGR